MGVRETMVNAKEAPIQADGRASRRCKIEAGDANARDSGSPAGRENLREGEREETRESARMLDAKTLGKRCLRVVDIVTMSPTTELIQEKMRHQLLPGVVEHRTPCF